jgi:hypothetical protein
MSAKECLSMIGKTLSDRCRLVLTLAWSLASLTALAQTPPELDQYGGLKSMNFGPGKFFRVQENDGRAWFVTPEGNAFFSVGVCVVNSRGDAERGTDHFPYNENILKKYGSVENWTTATGDRLKDWGVNTLGGWSGPELRGKTPYTIVLSLTGGLWGKGAPDMFSPETVEQVIAAADSLSESIEDPYLIGYFLDNELPWAPDWRYLPDVFSTYVALPPDAPGKKRLVEFFAERYGSLEKFANIWKTPLNDWNDLAHIRELTPKNGKIAQEDREAFLLLVARQYFSLTTSAIRSKDKNHLILGCRFVWSLAPKPVVQAAGELCDVVSLNHYEPGVVGNILLQLTDLNSMRIHSDLTFRDFYKVARKPLLITEFSFRSIDSGVPNTFPPGWLLQPKVPTQKARADKFEECAMAWIPQPYFLGYHWFQYVDEPNVGRFDGENGNYGLVNIADEPYGEFADRFKTINYRIWDLHSGR